MKNNLLEEVRRERALEKLGLSKKINKGVLL